ncbi:MAG: hypothetical protein H0X04_00130 [Chthoniobacterales bacterium]|nr:hypothetical protein [Chthoniobacterales bacterium]
MFEGRSAVERTEATVKLCNLIKEGTIPLSKISLLDLVESIMGPEDCARMRALSEDGDVYAGLQESVDPVNLKAFTHITGNVLTKGIVEGFKSVEFIGDSLVTSETDTIDEYTMTGLTPIEDDAMEVKEGDEYKTVKFGEDWQTLPASIKRGMRCAITREMIFFDRTSKAIEMANGVGYRLGLNKEKRILNEVLGVTNTYNRKGVARDTYASTAGDPRINKLTGNELLDYSQIEAVEQAIEAYNDDKTSGEPIQVNYDTMLVTGFKISTARRLMGAREVQHQSTDAVNGQTMQTYGPNPIGQNVKVITSPWIRRLLVAGGASDANAKKMWYLGAPKKAFRYTTLFPLQVRSMGRDSEDDFKRDVVVQYRADERGKVWTKSPWHMVKSEG